MSFKPLIIDTGTFKQLPSGQALDAGGWTLPTAGGTEDYVLTANGSGNAVWDTIDHGNLTGLTDDDHSQYSLVDGTRAFTGTVVGVDPIDSAHLATKEYVDSAIRVLQPLFLMDAAHASIPSTKNTSLVDPELSEADTTVAGLIDDDVIQTWARSDAESIARDIPAGTHALHFHAEKTGGIKTLQAYFKVFEVDSSFVETLITTSELSNVITTRSHFLIHASRGSPYSIAAGSWVMVRLYARVTDSGTDPTGVVYYQGITSSRFDTPVTSLDVNHGNLLGLDDDDHPQYVLNTGETSPVDLGSQTLTTTGTVVGSNIPAPTVDDQVLISTASGVASWSTAGNNQILGSDGSGEAAWENKSFGYDIPANSAVNEIYVGTGAGTAAWTTDLAGITSLTVDNITINGAVISSDTGAISFSDEDLTTAGTLYSTNATGGIFQAARTGGLADGYIVGSFEFYTYDPSTDGEGICAATRYECDGTWNGGVNEGHLGFYTQAQASPVSTLVERMTIDNLGDVRIVGGDLILTAGSLTVGNITIDGNTIDSDNGSIILNDNIYVVGRSEAQSSTGGIFRAKRLDTGLADGEMVGSFEFYTNDASTDAAGICGAMRYECDGTWNGGVNIGYLGFYTQAQASPVSTLVERMTIDNLGDVTIVGGDLTLTAGDLAVGNITISGASVTSNTGAISFNDEDLTTSGTVVGTNIPSPTTSGKALVSTAADTAAWYTTSLYDALKIEVPSASGAERKFVLTADPGSQFEIESAPWPLTLTANETIYIRTTGNDSTGDGSAGFPFLTVTKAIQYIGQLYIGDYYVTVDIGEGVFTEAATLTFQHPFGSQVNFTGVSEQITSQDTNSISASGTYLGYNQLYRYDVTFILPVGKSVSVGDYIGVTAVSGGTLPEALYGMHYVSGWVGGSRTATVQVVYRNNAPKASGTVTCTIDLVKTVIAFSNKNGLKIVGPNYGGNWGGLVFQGDWDGANNAKYGVWCLNTGMCALAGGAGSGFATGVVGFQTGLYTQNNALIFSDYCYVSKMGSRCANAQNGGILNLRYAKLSGTLNNGIFAFNGSTVAALNVKVVAMGDNAVVSYQGSFIDAQGAYVDQNYATNALVADRWSGIDANGSSYSDSISPSTPGNNDGSYVIIT